MKLKQFVYAMMIVVMVTLFCEISHLEFNIANVLVLIVMWITFWALIDKLYAPTLMENKRWE